MARIVRVGARSGRFYRSRSPAPDLPYMPKIRTAILDYSASTSSTRQQQQAAFDLVMLANSFLLGQSGQQAHAAAIKAINANAKVYQYVKVSEVSDNNANSNDIRDVVNTNNWWLRTAAGARVQQYAQAGEFDIGFHGFEPANGSGQKFLDWKVIRDRVLLQAAAIDGAFVDNVAWQNRITADFNRDGSDDANNTANPSQWIRTAMVSYCNKLRTDSPTRKFIGNIQNNTTTVHADYGDVYDYYFIEGLSGASYSPMGNSWGGFSRTVGLADSANVAAREPNGCIWNHHISSTTAYSEMRFGLGLCLMTESIFNCNNAGYSNTPIWFNEFDLRLGNPIEPRTNVSAGLWRRKYENGIVLVNTTGEFGGAGSSVSYDLTGQGYRRPGASDFTTAVQDVAWNTGATITSGSLAVNTALIGVKV